MIEAVRGYPALLRSPPEAANDRLAALAAALDQLACAYHATEEIARDDAPEFADRTTYEEMREVAIAAFADFGFYAATACAATLMPANSATKRLDCINDPIDQFESRLAPRGCSQHTNQSCTAVVQSIFGTDRATNVTPI